jgi:putative glutathione S-transferase
MHVHVDTEFEELATTGAYPKDPRGGIEDALDALYEPVNYGVCRIYRIGFARTQAAHDEAVKEPFDALDRFKGVLSRRRYLCCDRVSDTEWAFFTTLVRFDPLYHGHSKCNLGCIVDYPNL